MAANKSRLITHEYGRDKAIIKLAELKSRNRQTSLGTFSLIMRFIMSGAVLWVIGLVLLGPKVIPEVLKLVYRTNIYVWLMLILIFIIALKRR